MAERWKPTETQTQEIYRMAMIGLTEAQISRILGVGESTFQHACKKDDALRQTVLKGREKGNDKVHQTLFDMATNGKNPAATIFWMKVRSHWKETQVIEHTGADGAPIETTEVKSKRIEEKLARLKLMLSK